MPTGPEIAVRLSAAGVSDVIQAFQRVRQEGKTTGQQTTAAFSAINGQLSSLAALLPAISVGVAVASLSQFALDAREATENVGKLAEKTGGSVGTLSALALAAHDSEVSFDDMSGGMVKLAKAQYQAAQGGKEQLSAFKQLGIGIQQINQLNAADMFALVAQKIGQMPAGSQRTALALQLMGKSAAGLIPMLDSLGKDGIDQVIAKAKALGLYLDEDMVNSSRAAQDALHKLEDIASGLATRFNAGFMPGATAGIEVLAEELTGNGVNAMKTFGEKTGIVLAYVISYITLAVETAKNGFKDLLERVGYDANVAVAFLKDGLKGAQNYTALNGAAHDQRLAQLATERKADTDRIQAELKQALAENKQSVTSSTHGGGAMGDGQSDEERKKNAAKRLEDAAKVAKSFSDLMQARADNEIAIIRAAAAMEEADDKRKYDAGLLSLDEYYNRRQARIEAAFEAESAALNDKLNAAYAMPTKGKDDAQSQELWNKRAQEIDRIEAQRTELAIKEQTELAANEDDRFKARQDNTEKLLTLQQQLSRADGDSADAAQAALEKQLIEYQKLEAAAGKLPEQIDAAVAEYRRLGEAKIGFDQAQRDASAEGTSLNLGVQDIRNRQGTGAISQIQATAATHRIQQQSLENMRSIGDDMLANAVTDEDFEKVAEYVAKMDELQASMQNVKTAGAELSDQLANGGMSALTDSFTDAITGAKSFGDAMGDLADTFEKMVGRMISQLLVFYLLETLVGFIAPGSDFLSDLQAAGPFGKITGFDSGGWTGGTAGKPAGIVHGQEFVVKAGPAAQHRDMLEAMNAGLLPMQVASASQYASPDPASYGTTVVAQTAAPVINISTPPGTQAQTKQSQGKNGQSITDIIITTVATDMARGGKTAQTMASTYGLTRQGRPTG